MKQILTKQQMLDEWKLRRYHEPATRVDSTITRHFGVDIDRICEHEMRAWYLDLLDNGDLRHLALSDYSMDVNLTLLPDNSFELLLPEGTRRVVDVKLSCWDTSATIYDRPTAKLLRHLGNPFVRPQAVPIAIVKLPHLRLYSLPAGYDSARLMRLHLVVDPGPDTYILDDSALSLIN